MDRNGIFCHGVCLKNKRPSNMDRILLCRGEIKTSPLAFFAVCDGVGSSELGEQVAEFVVQRLEEWFYKQKTFRQIDQSLGKEIFLINQDIVEKRKGKSGSCTLSGILATPEKNFFVHVGDSRIYQQTKNKFRPMTEDHVTEKGELFDFMGKEHDLAIDFWEEPQRGGSYLLCSDGFYHLMDWELAFLSLCRASRSKIGKIIEELTELVIAKGERDNCSVIYCNIDGIAS
ncbi:MAG: protein phosphatase 2C domain-containing protein [Eubacteriales bacterium]